MSELTDVVDRQVEAYNAHDIDAFCDCYAEDAVIVSGGGGDTLMEGIDAIREQYARLFEQVPDLSVRIGGRIEVNDWVADREVASLDTGEQVAGAAYRIRGGRIDRVVLLT